MRKGAGIMERGANKDTAVVFCTGICCAGDGIWDHEVRRNAWCGEPCFRNEGLIGCRDFIYVMA